MSSFNVNGRNILNGPPNHKLPTNPRSIDGERRAHNMQISTITNDPPRVNLPSIWEEIASIDAQEAISRPNYTSPPIQASQTELQPTSRTPTNLSGWVGEKRGKAPREPLLLPPIHEALQSVDPTPTQHIGYGIEHHGTLNNPPEMSLLNSSFTPPLPNNYLPPMGPATSIIPLPDPAAMTPFPLPDPAVMPSGSDELNKHLDRYGQICEQHGVNSIHTVPRPMEPRRIYYEGVREAGDTTRVGMYLHAPQNYERVQEASGTVREGMYQYEHQYYEGVREAGDTTRVGMYLHAPQNYERVQEASDRVREGMYQYEHQHYEGAREIGDTTREGMYLHAPQNYEGVQEASDRVREGTYQYEHQHYQGGWRYD
ncbi:hypothetical protein F4821DRAFT_107632 [Hypoxylon rubiginosum]|uniref:Uncharacterized protein n=1 Tax=Hypoxylon rubiginosum TaxID=110542 RepID=A0ACC0D3X1_9PEZI|nr:hypothetical protein F4821DRAFT_107632 [Hypoxylon rubiginosum]